VIPALVMALFALSAAFDLSRMVAAALLPHFGDLAAVLAGVLFAIGINRLDARNLAPR